MAKNGNGTKINVARLQVQVDFLQKDITEIKDNHLVHIYDRIGALERKIAYWAGGMAMFIVVVELIIKFF